MKAEWFYRTLLVIVVVAVINIAASDPLGVSAWIRGEPIDSSCYAGDKTYPDGVPDYVCK